MSASSCPTAARRWALGFLAGRRPLVTLALRDFAITFGS